MRDDGILPSVATSIWDDSTRMGGVATVSQEQPKARNPLDSASSERLLSRLRSWYDQEWDRQAYNRFQMAMDEDYYDALQWSQDEAETLLDRGQAPVVYNEIKSTIDWMIGTERRTRVDYKVLPRRKEGSQDAEVKTDLLKYLSDTNGEPMARSQAFSMACKAGLGWIEVGVRGDSTDEPIYYKSDSWRRNLHDSNAFEHDLSDGRYHFRWRYLDVDVACAYFPDRASVLKRAAVGGDQQTLEDDELWYMGARVTDPGYDYAGGASKYRAYDGAAFSKNARERVKITECWYREPVTQKAMLDGANGVASTFDKVVMQVRCAVYCEAGLLWEGPSPYRHDRFPFVPVWSYRRSRDNAPYGPVRGMRDAQDGLNKRASKALWILSSNRIIMEDGAVDDIEDLRDEAARPDAIIVKKRAKELTIDRDTQLAEEHLMLADKDREAIRSAGGVTTENLGRDTNATSGKAIIAKQQQGGVVTTELFDNLRFAIQIAGEIELSLIEQTFTQPKIVRLVGDRGNATFVAINQLDPTTGEIINDITANEADFHLAQADYRDSMRQAMYESLMDIVSRLAQMSPDIAFKLLDLVVEMADVPNRDELVSRIRELNGMRDPNSDPTPEEQAKLQAQAQEQAQQKELLITRAAAELADLKAKVAKTEADSVAVRLVAMQSALGAAQTVAMVPSLGPLADEIMHGAGYADQAVLAEVSAQRDTLEARQASQAMLAADAQSQGQVPAMSAPGQQPAPPPAEPSAPGLPQLPGA